LPEIEGGKPARKRFASYPVGCFRVDPAEVSTEQGKPRLFVAVARTSRLAFVRLVESAGKMAAARFLRDLVEAVPHRRHAALTDNGIRFTAGKQDIRDRQHIFDRVCDEHGSEHRPTKVNHPLGDLPIAVPAGTDRGRCPRWTNGRVERRNRTIKDATVKRHHHDRHDQRRAHLALFVDAPDHARRLETLRGLTPYGFIVRTWTREPERFGLDPPHHIPGPCT
jgi:hypothetical protein